MPIRFYCPFCDTLLGIASHKVGAVVECPSCHGKVGVPHPDAPPLIPPPPPRPTSRVVLGAGQLAGLGCVLVLLMGIAFVTGLLVGALG